MASGVKVDEVVKLKYDDIKKKKSYRYLVFYIKDEKVIQVEKVGDRNADYQEFLQDLYVGGPDDCRSLFTNQISLFKCLWAMALSGI